MELNRNIYGKKILILRCFDIKMENAIIMVVEKKILGLEEDGKINILDVKCDPDLVGMLIQTYGFLPGYHMNKRHWITILLDESVSEAKTLDFLDMSYDLIDSGK